MVSSARTALNPTLLSERFAQRFPDIPGFGASVAIIARKLTPMSYRLLGEMAHQLVIRERRRPSVSAGQLLAVIRGAVLSANQAGAVSMAKFASLGSNAAELAVIIILMMIEDGDQDLNQKMAEAQAQMAAKQALRALLNALSNTPWAGGNPAISGSKSGSARPVGFSWSGTAAAASLSLIR
jgi:hypothetical protein